MKTTISEIKNTPEGITTRLGEAEDRVSEREDKVERNTQIEETHEKKTQKT